MKEFTESNGARWKVEIASHGRTSDYLNPRVHRPILQFTCLDGPRPRRYVGSDSDEVSLEAYTEDQLRTLLGKASSH